MKKRKEFKNLTSYGGVIMGWEWILDFNEGLLFAILVALFFLVIAVYYIESRRTIAEIRKWVDEIRRKYEGR